MAKIKVNLHIDTKDAEASVKDLVVSALRARNVLLENIASVEKATAEYEAKFAAVTASFKAASNKQLDDALKAVNAINAAVDGWSK